MTEQLARIRRVAREHGYAIAVHGSEQRDLDLIAVPWTAEATDAHSLVDALCVEVPLYVEGEPVGPVPGDPPPPPIRWPEPKPWGRLGWVLHGVGGVQYVDLSVTPRSKWVEVFTKS